MAMDFLRHEKDIDAVVPGVTDAYRQLRSSQGQGLYTSLGRYYNHTIFGRDAGMTAKFVSFFDHETAWRTIQTLASYQGQTDDGVTHEQPGKIHHEMRDYTTWHGRWYDRLGLELAGRTWGKRGNQLVSYYAADATATYIRLVHKYAGSIDRSIIDRAVVLSSGRTVPLADSVAAAANWLVRQVDSEGLFWVRRSNRWSLPYQTFADSVTAYAWMDGSPADTARPHSFVEVQAHALDALSDAARLLPAHPDSETWRLTSSKMQRTLLERFWSDDRQTLAQGVFHKDGDVRVLDTDMITATWALNVSFWDDLPAIERQARLEKIIGRAFSDDYLTSYGIRTKSRDSADPLGVKVIDYHGSQTIWPMFNFMFIEGLRRHGLYRLARQVENRLLNTINALGDFPEFFIVNHENELYRPDKKAALRLSGQMIPEQNIAFTVVPATTLAYRHIYPRHEVAETGWEHDFEQSVLESIESIDLLTPDEARQQISATPVRIKRTMAGLRSARHIAPVILKKPS